MTTRYGHKREMEGSKKALGILNEYGKSMARSRLEYGWSMGRVWLRYTLVMLLMVAGVSEVWGVTVTYHIINLGRLDDSGQLTDTRTEALRFTVTGETVTVGVPDKYKSPLAKNWAYYSSSDVTYNSSTKVCTFNSGPSLNVGDALNDGAHVYVTYELDEDAFCTVSVEDGGIYRIKFPNNYYLRQDTWYNSQTKITEINTSSSSLDVSIPTPNVYLWKFNIVDPYQITIQSQSNDYTNHYLSSKTGNNTFSDIRLQPTLAEAKATKAWAFSLLPGGTDGTYRLIVADGSTVSTASGNQLDSSGHGYLNNKRDNYKTTYHLYNYTNYERCDLTIEFLSAKYKFHIINHSGEEAISARTASALNAGETITESMMPDILKSPAACNYSFYPTAEDAIAGTNELSSLPYSSIPVYVRYETSGTGIYLNGEIKYNISVGGEHYLYAADATTISSAATNNVAKTYRWALQGGDPYQFTIKNVDNNQFITYDVSGGEAVPTLSGTGSKFFLHQSTTGTYELVAMPSNNYPTSYYTLGYNSTNGLKLYSNTNCSFGNDEIQTAFTPVSAAIIDPIPTANDLTYNGLEQELVTAGTCEHGTVKYREGTTGEYVTTIPTKKDAGTYSVYYMSEGEDDFEDFVAVDPIIVTISPAAATVTADNKSKTYGNSDPTLTATVTGMVNSESPSLITYTFSRAEGEVAGKYDIIPAGNALQGNYAVTFVNGKLTINKRTIDITWGETSLPYNGTPQAPTATATNLVYGDVIGITVTGEKTDVGTGYTATASALTGTKAGNYSLPGAKTKTFSIIKGEINTTINIKEWSYGDYDELTNSPSISFNPENLEITYKYKVKDADDETYVTDVPINLGTYTVQATIPETPNHYSKIITKDFTITQKAFNKDAAGSPANGITITVSKVITNPGTEDETITYPVTVTHDVQGTPTPLIQYVDDEHDYDYKVSSGSYGVSGYVVTITAKNEDGLYTGNYTGFAKAAYPEPTFYLDGAKWSPSENEYAAVYLGLSDGVPNPVAIESEVKAYIVRRVNQTIGTVTVSPVEYISDATTDPPTKTNYIPKGVPVLLLSNNDNPTGFAITSLTEDTSDITETVKNNNQLMISPDEPSNPSVQNSPHGVAVKDAEAYVFYRGEFVLTKEGTISPGKFFLYNPNYTPSSAGGGGGDPSGVRRYLRIVVEENEDPTGMDNGLRATDNGQGNDLWYTLDGRRLDGKPTRKGIYITNGKKMYFK